MLSTAINILGDITELDLDEDKPGPVTSMMGPGALSRSDEEVEVGGSEPHQLGPILMIRLAPMTKYLRRYPCNNYSDGTWIPPRNPEGILYNGQYLSNNITFYSSQSAVEFYVEPLIDLSSWVLVAQNTYHVEFNSSLNYFPRLQSFRSGEMYDDPYWVSWKQYFFSESVLRSKRAIKTDETLQIPGGLKTDFRRRAETITVGKNSDYEKYQAIADYLIEKYEWNKEYEPAPPGIDPVKWFLFNAREGIGSHFNSAFILLARSIGLPVRAVIGYTVDPLAEIQYVLPQQAYLWAEVEFEDIGWITFDASPKHYMEGNVNITREDTFTNITGNDPVALKGKQFNVWGTVEMANGTGVSDLQVEIILKEDKYDENETGLIVGVDVVQNGEFNITCDAAVELEVGDYNLIAHALENRYFRESFSDPPIRIMTETEVSIQGPKRIYEGRNITYRGFVRDSATGEALPNASLLVNFADKMYNLLSDENGKVSYTVMFPDDGTENMTLEMKGTDYYVGSKTEMAINVVVPPPSPNSILALLLGFPQNIIIAVSAAIGVGIFASKRSKKLEQEEVMEPRVKLPDPNPRIGYEDGIPLDYETYEEGVVKLFHRFYVSMQRKFPDIDDSMTPREFETLLMEKVPKNAYLALEDLVTSYEIAMFSNLQLSQEDFKRTNATIDLIIELIKK
jgi:transglutaminase-like putative cysteine protease